MSQSMTPGTRERILEALADIVLEGGLSDFSVQGVADRCGISHRTVYRHFPTRESMLDGLVEQMDESMAAAGGAAQVHELDDLAPAIARNFALFDANGAVARAGVRFSIGTATEPADRRRRTDAIARAVAALDLGPDDVRMVAVLLRHLSSSRTWLLLREAGLDSQDTTRAASWAAAALIAAIRAGDLPTDTPALPSDPTDSEDDRV